MPGRPRLNPTRGDSGVKDIWEPRKAVGRGLALETRAGKKQGPRHRTGQQGTMNLWEMFRFSKSDRLTLQILVLLLINFLTWNKLFHLHGFQFLFLHCMPRTWLSEKHV